MKVPYYRAGIVLFSQFIHPITAYSISLDCEDPSGLPSKTTDVQDAIDTWKAMAAYAIGRAADTNQQHRQGNLLQAMLGAPSENDQSTLTYVTTWLNKALTQANNINTVFTCTDKHLTTIDANSGVYRDNIYGANSYVRAPRTGPLAPGVTNACGGQVEAFTYSTGTVSVVVLCSDWPGAALNAYDRVDIDDFRGKNWAETTVAANVGIDLVSRRLVYKIAHEMMHAASTTQFPASLPVPNGEAVPELYQYQAITGTAVGTALNQALAPAATTRRQNADSFALLVCGWFMRASVVTNGQMIMVQPADYTRNKYPAPVPVVALPPTKLKRIALPDRRQQPESMTFDLRVSLEKAVSENMQISYI